MNNQKADLKIAFDVALSFAGEDRPLAEKLANELASRGVRVFYDGFFKGELWGKDLYEYLADLYEKRAEYCVMLVSKPYYENKWTNHERKNAQARALIQGSEYILPIRIDDTVLPGLPATIAYLDIRKEQLSDVVDAIVDKIHNGSEAALERRAGWVEAQFWKRGEQPGYRFGCCRCGSTWRGPDNIHYCLHCQSVYCVRCVPELPIVPGVAKYKRRCPCGGRVY